MDNNSGMVCHENPYKTNSLKGVKIPDLSQSIICATSDDKLSASGAYGNIWKARLDTGTRSQMVRNIRLQSTTMARIRFSY